MNLEEFFTIHSNIGIAFSGGTDSALLLYEANKHAQRVHAFFVHSAFQPSFEYEDALRFAKQYDIPLTVIDIDILSDKSVISNPGNRCYYCKKVVFEHILLHAVALGITELADGTNASDDISDRPGYAALLKAGIYSPLRLCGLTKDMIRELSREYGLFTGEKPSYACLATRIPAGHPITLEHLKRIEASEALLKELGFKDFRLRLLPVPSQHPAGKLQITEEQFPLALKKRADILTLLSPYFSDILLDLATRTVTD